MGIFAESMLLGISLLIMIAAVVLTCSFLSAWAAGRKYRNRKIWFLIGFFFPVVGLATALLIPSTREPYALKTRRHRRAVDADIKSGNKGFQQRATGVRERMREMDEAANRLNKRLQEVGKHLRGSDPYRIERRRSRLRRRLNWTPQSEHRTEINAEMEALEEELITRKQLEEKAGKLRKQLMNTAAVAEKLSHRIKRLSFGAEDSAPSEEELQEILEEVYIEVEALEELHRKID